MDPFLLSDITFSHPYICPLGMVIQWLTKLFPGTGVLAQFGVWIMIIWTWVAVLRKPVILFSGHPLAQTVGILALVQAILVVQPTHTGDQKRRGRIIHGSLNLVSFLAFVTGVTIIEYNKISSGGVHFHSVHGYLGVITSIILGVQYIVGFTMWLVPALYGGEENAKSLYKYHRMSGYFILALLMATVISATKTDFNVNVLGLQLWGAVILSILILAGVYPRIQRSKLGLRAVSQSS